MTESNSSAVVSIVLSLSGAAPRSAENSINSVLAQSAENWQLILVRDPSRRAISAALLAELDSDDRVLFLDAAADIDQPSALELAAEAATGEFIFLLDAGDTLRDDAVQSADDFTVANPDVDLFHSDEIEFGIDGGSVELRKPVLSVERLRSQMYFGRLCAFRLSTLRDLGLLTDLGSAAEHDLALRISETGRVGRLTRTVYERQRREGDNPPLLVVDEGSARQHVRAIDAHLERVGILGHTEWQRNDGTFRVVRQIIGDPLVSVVIPTRGGSAVIRGENSCLVVDAVKGIIEKSTYTNLEFVIVADTVTPAEVIDELRTVAGDRLRLVEWDQAFNFSGKVNKGAIYARGDYLLILNDDVEIITADWIEAMLGLAQQDEVGLVGALLYFEDGTVQHGGHLYTAGGAGHIGFGWAEGSDGLPGSMAVDREVSGVTAACIVLPRPVFFEVGGFTRILPSNFNDVDFCMKVTGAGHKVVWSPYAKLFHFESKSRVSTVVEYEVTTIYSRWQHRMAVDPHWPTSARDAGLVQAQ